MRKTGWLESLPWRPEYTMPCMLLQRDARFQESRPCKTSVQRPTNALLGSVLNQLLLSIRQVLNLSFFFSSPVWLVGASQESLRVILPGHYTHPIPIHTYTHSGPTFVPDINHTLMIRNKVKQNHRWHCSRQCTCSFSLFFLLSCWILPSPNGFPNSDKPFRRQTPVASLTPRQIPRDLLTWQ